MSSTEQTKPADGTEWLRDVSARYDAWVASGGPLRSPPPPPNKPGFWTRIVHRIGGVHDLWRLSLVIHDRGVHLSWVRDQVERWRIGT